MKKLTLALTCFLISMGLVIAQNKQVSGTVVDEAGMPVIGASIGVKGDASIGTVTDLDGKFTLNVPASAKALTIRYLGMTDREVAVQSVVNVVLKHDDKVLDEVLITAYGGVIKKSSLSGAISQLGGDEINNLPVQSFDQALAGKVAGVHVVQSSGLLADGISVRIRGTNSISLSSQPLVVIDGIPVTEATNLNVFNGGNGTRFNPMATINPNDIETIEVLKDAAAAALYGSRAANGVLLITTKRGQTNKANISYNGYVGVASPTRLPKLLNAADFIEINNEKARNRWGENAIIAAWDDNKTETNWVDLVFRDGFTQNHSVSVSGGTEKWSVYGSADWTDQTGITLGNALKRGSVRLNADLQATKWLKIGISSNYSHTLNKGVLSDGYLAGATIAAYNAPPTSPNKINGKFNLENGLLGKAKNLYTYEGVNTYLNAFYHPVATIELQRNDNTSERVLANGYLELSPIEGLKITTKLGIDHLNNFEDQYSHPSIAGLGRGYGGLVQDNIAFIKQWNWQNFANYSFKLQDHSIALMAGMEYQYRKYRDIYAGAGNFVFDTCQDILDGLFVNQFVGGTMNSRGFNSYFGRVNYDWKDKYIVEAAFRADAYSGFNKSKRRGYFPGVSAAWRVSEESFWAVDAANDLKIRGSWGIVGNSNVDPYAYRTLYAGGQYADINGVSLVQIGSESLQWEQVEKIDAGIDLSFFKSRLVLAFDYWRTNVNNMILDAPVIHIAGIPGSKISTNIGEMRNQGVEIQLNSTNITTNDFSWTSTLNLTTVNNKVIALAGDDILGTSCAIVGETLGVWRVYEYAGVDPQTGRPGYYDANNRIKYYNGDYAVPTSEQWKFADGSPAPVLGTNDLKIQRGKSGTPKWYGNFDNTVQYKSFDLTLGLEFAGGHYLLNQTNAGLMTTLLNNNIDLIKQRWTTPGQQTDIPKLYHGRTGIQTASTYWLEKADFLRFRDLTIGYNLPSGSFEKMGITALRVYLRGSNLAVLTKYTGTDPDISTGRNQNISVGYDNRSVPYPRTFTLGLNVSF
jgi:TonB-linked SusC/RagA family outer membrane protein